MIVLVKAGDDDDGDGRLRLGFSEKSSIQMMHRIFLRFSRSKGPK
jgi:hypothetical protein